jgi:hypothetical protein
MKPYENILVAFMKDMHQWELMCSEREQQCDSGELDDETSESIGISEYMDIFKKYCSHNAIPRNYSFSDPPEYNPEGELIESIRSENVHSDPIRKLLLA